MMPSQGRISQPRLLTPVPDSRLLEALRQQPCLHRHRHWCTGKGEEGSLSGKLLEFLEEMRSQKQ